jgi:transcriptional regulator with XRE-family HTH domain
MIKFSSKANNMQKAQTWRNLLADIIRDRKEKQRLIDVLGVTSITLTRWVNGESDPRPQNLRRLISVLPQSYEQLEGSLKEESPFSGEETALEPTEPTKEISSKFYAQVLQTRASTSEHLLSPDFAASIAAARSRMSGYGHLGYTLYASFGAI